MAVKAAGLVDTLSGTGPFTVFAPNNKAFAKIPEATLKELMADKAKLTNVLTGHVVAGKVMSKDVAGMKTATTLAKTDVKISTESGVMINDAKVLTPDIECSNGVIHVIDTVLMS